MADKSDTLPNVENKLDTVKTANLVLSPKCLSHRLIGDMITKAKKLLAVLS